MKDAVKEEISVQLNEYAGKKFSYHLFTCTLRNSGKNTFQNNYIEREKKFVFAFINISFDAIECLQMFLTV